MKVRVAWDATLRQILEHRTIAPGAPAFGNDRLGYRIAGFENYRRPEKPGFLASHLAAQRRIVEPPAIVPVIAGKLGKEPVGYDRPLDARRQIIFGPGFNARLTINRKLVFWPPSREQHSTASHVATLQCALWAAQDFDAFEVERIEIGTGIDAQINAIDEHADRRLRIRIARSGTQPPDVGRRVTARAAIRAKRNAGRPDRDVGQVLKMRAIELGRSERGDRHWNVLQPLSAIFLLRRDDNVFQAISLVGRGLVGCGLARCGLAGHGLVGRGLVGSCAGRRRKLGPSHLGSAHQRQSEHGNRGPHQPGLPASHHVHYPSPSAYHCPAPI